MAQHLLKFLTRIKINNIRNDQLKYSSMEIIIFEEDTYWRHIHEVVKRVKVTQHDERKWIDEPEAMELLGIKSKSEMWKMRSQGKIRYS